jgi:hypothetical protein
MTRALLLMALVVVGAAAQSLRTYRLGTVPAASDRMSSNSVNEIVVSGDTVWVGTSRGLSVATGTPVQWTNWSSTAPFTGTGISGIAISGDLVWVSAATSTKQDNESLPTGDGLYRSTDRGTTWTRFDQPVDVGSVDTLTYGVNRIAALNITTTINNITYDLAIGAGAVWSANFAGMLRRSTDQGATWTRVVLPPDGRSSIAPSDTLDFDLAPTGGRLGLRGNLNHRVFSVMVDGDGVVWVGTAGGINRSTDGGTSWTKFSRTNQAQPISGNFVVGLREQRWAGTKTIWAATVNAESGEEQRGVSWSTDGGATWKTGLLGEFAHNIAVRDSIVYVATDGGLYRTSDRGASWQLNGSIVDAVTYQRVVAPEAIAVAVRRDTVWLGGPDGLALTPDEAATPFGTSWSVLRAFQPVSAAREMYVYPNPFSPAMEPARVHFAVPTGGASVTIRIFDIAMQPVRDLLIGAGRPNGQHDEVWDGRTSGGRLAANGVYFVRVQVGDADAVWGKVVVLQ